MDVATFRRLLEPDGQRLLATLPQYDDATALAVATRARREGFDPELVAAAVSLSRLRRRGRAKLGDLADRLYLTDDTLEQATRPAVAARHAARYARLAPARVADLGCGAAGDLLQLAAAGPDLLAVDRDQLTCELARANLAALNIGERATVLCADVTDLGAGGIDGVEAVYVDPSRRSSAGRTFDPRAYSPPYQFVLDLAERMPATGAKLAPGIAHHLLPATAEAEWVSDGGEVLECALWFGPLSTGVRRRATVLPSGATLTGDGLARAEAGPVRRYLHEPDGAVIRAGLVADLAQRLAGTLVDPTIAYLTTEAAVSSPFATSYEVTDVLPFQLKRLRALLRSRGVGRLTVKKRGSAIEPDALRRQLRLTGPEEATVVLTRVAGRPTALLVRPAGRR